MNLADFIRKLIEAILKFFGGGSPDPGPPPPEEEDYYEEGYIAGKYMKKQKKETRTNEH